MSDAVKKLYRSRKNRMLAGVCAGLADYMGVDATIIRLLAVVSLLISVGTSAFVYLVFWLIIPEEPEMSAGTVVDVDVKKEE